MNDMPSRMDLEGALMDAQGAADAIWTIVERLAQHEDSEAHSGLFWAAGRLCGSISKAREEFYALHYPNDPAPKIAAE